MQLWIIKRSAQKKVTKQKDQGKTHLTGAQDQYNATSARHRIAWSVTAVDEIPRVNSVLFYKINVSLKISFQATDLWKQLPDPFKKTYSLVSICFSYISLYIGLLQIMRSCIL